MKVSVDFGSEIDAAVQRHLNDGTNVKAYVRAAVSYFNKMLQLEEAGNSVGYGDKNRFSSYNRIVSAKEELADLS